jgi:Amidohydrolase.
MRAGFGKRLMFGTDQMYWPEGIAMAVDAVHSAPFLSPGEKRDIFYSNAARFYKPPLPDLAVLRSAFTDGRMRVLGEVTTQYAGLTLDDPKYAPYLALAEELDIPVALHTGTMPPGMSFDPCDLRYPISIDEERAEHLAADPGSDVVRRYRTKPPVKSRYPLSNSQSGR